jgi:hypothetical protein
LKPNLISPWLNSGIAFYYEATRHHELHTGESTVYFKKSFEMYEKAANAAESRVSGVDLLYSAYFNFGMALYVQGTHHLTTAQQAPSTDVQESELNSAYD